MREIFDLIFVRQKYAFILSTNKIVTRKRDTLRSVRTHVLVKSNQIILLKNKSATPDDIIFKLYASIGGLSQIGSLDSFSRN